MRKETLIVGAIVVVIALVFIPTSRLIKETRTETWWEYNEDCYGYHCENELKDMPEEIYLTKEQRWTVKMLDYGEEYHPTFDGNKLYIQLYDYSDTLIYDVPYETLRKMPRGWEPVPVDGWYKIELEWKPGPVGIILWGLGHGECIGTYTEIVEISDIYPYGFLFPIGLLLVILGAIISMVGVFIPQERS